MADDFGKWLASKSREFGVEPVPSKAAPSNFLDMVAKNPHGYGGFLPDKPAPEVSDEPTYRMTMLPLGTYAGPDGQEHLGFAVPGMIQEPINALYRLAQNSVDENGNIAIPNPENPQNREDVLTGILSLYGGNALNPLTTLPENAVGMFAGRMAKTADHDALARAEDLAAKGAPRDQIWQETGWFRQPDGKWRFEIDDSGAKIGGKALADLMKGGTEGATQRTLAGVIHHSPLYDAYPDLRRIDVDARFNPRLRIPEAQYQDVHPSTGRPAINISTNTLAGDFGPLSAGLHEVQHGIQTIERTAKGGNPTAVSEMPSPEAINDARVMAAFVRRGVPLSDAPAAFLNATGRDVVPEARILLEESANDLDALHRMPASPLEYYKRLAGEVEARNVQKRMDMTPEERRATPPWLTQDVPDEDQIIKFLSDTGKPSLMGAAVAGAEGNTPIRAYRGSIGQQDFRGDKIWAADSPDIAGTYANYWPDDFTPDGPKVGSVAPVDLNFSNPLTVDARGHSWNNIPDPSGSSIPASTDRLANFAREDGYDGLIIKNILDRAGNETGKPGTTYVALKRGTVRSPLTGEILFNDVGQPSLMGSALASSREPDPSFKDDLLRMMNDYGIAPPVSQAPSQPANYLIGH